MRKTALLLLPFVIVLASCGGGTSNSTVPTGAQTLSDWRALDLGTLGVRFPSSGPET